MRFRVAATVAAVGLAAAFAYFGYRVVDGHRYRLYTSSPAGDCWRAVELTTLSSSDIEPERVDAPSRDADGRIHVSIGYTMDRVLGGKTLNVSCIFGAEGGALEAVEFDGVALDRESLAELNRDLGR